MSHPTPMLTFQVFRGNQLLKRAEFEKASVTIGSGPAAGLSIDSDDVADLHAVVNCNNGTVHVLDLGSPQGTRVDGAPITSNQALNPGQAIELGDIRIVVTIGGEEDEDLDDATDEEDAATVVADQAAIMAQAQEAQDARDRAAAAAARRDEGEEQATQPAVVEAPAAIPTPAPQKTMAAPEPVAAAPEGMDPADDDDEEEEPLEDVMTFIMRSGTGQSTVGVDKDRPKVLEVNQLWENVLLDTKHFPTAGKVYGFKVAPRAITVGASVGWKWSILGVHMSWVPGIAAPFLRQVPPLWSEVTSDWRDDFYAPDTSLPDGDHRLFEWNDGHYEACVKESWDGFVDLGTSRYSFGQLVADGKARKEGEFIHVPLTDDERLMVDVNGTVFFAQMVAPGRQVLQRNSEVDYPFMAIFSLVGFLGLMVAIYMYFSGAPNRTEMVEIPDRFVELLLEKPPEEQPKDKPSGNPDAGEGAKAKKEEGKVGKKDAKLEKAKGAKVEKQEIDRQVAESAGVLGALRDGGELDGLLGGAGLSSDITGGLGGLLGAKGTQIGSGGLGSRGSGMGGGGTAEGLGGLGTKGVGGGSSGFGAGGGNFGAKGEGAIGTVGGDPIILGALDRSLIDEVIKRHMSQIRYCYQRELTKDPALSGKITVKFVIAKDGTVSSAETKATTMNNDAVESCVVGRFMRMQFPAPKGGGIVVVSYPFLFSPG